MGVLKLIPTISQKRNFTMFVTLTESFWSMTQWDLPETFMSRTLSRKFSTSLRSLISVHWTFILLLKISICPKYDTLLLTPQPRWPTLSPPRGRGPGWGPSTSGALTPPWPPSSAWSLSSSSSSPSCAQSASTSSSGQTASGRRWEREDEYCHLFRSV